MQHRAVTASRYHASQLPQPLPQYYTMIGRGAAEEEDADLRGKCIVYAVDRSFECVICYPNVTTLGICYRKFVCL